MFSGERSNTIHPHHPTIFAVGLKICQRMSEKSWRTTEFRVKSANPAKPWGGQSGITNPDCTSLSSGFFTRDIVDLRNRGLQVRLLSSAVFLNSATREHGCDFRELTRRARPSVEQILRYGRRCGSVSSRFNSSDQRRAVVGERGSSHKEPNLQT
jgi:hypothetical protein